MRLTWRENVGNFFSLLLLTMLACGSWLLASISEFNSASRGGEGADEVSSVIEEVVVTRTDSAGSPAHELRAQRIEQFNDGHAVLIGPTIRQARPNQAKLNIVADHGILTDNRDAIEFSGNVFLTRSAIRGEPSVEVQTNSLRYQVKLEVATTKEEVKITRGDTTLFGVGMTADHGNNRFEITSSTNMVLPPSTTQGAVVRLRP